MSVSVRRVAELFGTFFGVSALLVIGLVSGLGIWMVTVELVFFSVRVVFLESHVSLLIFTSFLVVSGVYVTVDAWREKGSPEKVVDGPKVRAIVPAYRDAEVLDISVGSLLESGYENLGIAVVVEPDDRETRERAEELADEHDAVECLVNGNPGSKGSAINYGVSKSTARYFAVFDVDEEISPDFIPRAMGYLLEDTDVFQGRRIPRPVGAVETLAYCERLVVHTGYALGEIFGFTNCLSASTAFTREAFEEVGGYDDNLTEDIEFAHSCNRAGLSMSHDRSCTNTMEAPHTLRDFWGQRKRWRIGHVQVFQARLREAVRGKISLSSITSVGRASGAIVAGAFLIVVASHIFLLALNGVESAFLVPFFLSVVTMGAVWAKDYHDGRVGILSPTVLLTPLVYFLHGVFTMKALLEYYLTWDGEWYQVTKTGS